MPSESLQDLAKPANRWVAFDLRPETEDDGTCVLAALAQLTDQGVGVAVKVQEPWRGIVTGPDETASGESMRQALSSAGFSGTAQIGPDHFEFQDGASRVAGWQSLTTQLEIQISPQGPSDAQIAVAALTGISHRADVVDLDVADTRGSLHVLASVQDPEIFLIAVHSALRAGGFQGGAVLGAHGRWTFGPEAAKRLDEGVRI